VPKIRGKQTILVKKSSTVVSKGRAKEDGANLRRYISQYMDETVKNKANSPMPPFRFADEEYRRKHGVEQRETPQKGLRQGVDYLTKEPKGHIRVHGFLRRLVEAETQRKLDDLSNGEIGDAVEKIWKAMISRKGLKKIAHKFVFSIDPEVAAKMREKGMPIDEHLNRIVAETFRRYQEKFYPGQELGYLDGIHHDRAHPHSHILLYPQTAEGKPLNVSRATKAPNLKINADCLARVDYQEFIIQTAIELGQELEIAVSRPPALGPRPIDFHQERLLSQAAWDKVSKTGIPTDDPFFAELLLTSRRELDEAPAKHVRQVLQDQYEKEIKEIQSTSSEDATKTLGEVGFERLFWSQRLKKLGAARPPKPLALGDVAMARGVLMGWQWIEWGGMEGRWWNERAKQDDDLGRWMRNTQEDLGANFGQYDRESGLMGGHLTYIRKRRLIDRQIEQLNSLRRWMQSNSHETRIPYRTTKESRLDQVAVTRCVAHVLTGKKLRAEAVLTGTRPYYLHQFERLKARNEDFRLNLPDRVFVPVSDEAKIERRREIVAQSRPIAPEEILEAQPRPQDASLPEDTPVVVIPAPMLSGPGALQPIIAIEGPKTAFVNSEERTLDQEALDELGITL
jgi:hypothetical protein